MLLEAPKLRALVAASPAALLLLLGLPGCSGEPERSLRETTAPRSPRPGGTLVAGIGADPESLDPHRTTAYSSFEVLENVYDTLVEPGEDLQMEPALAAAWEVSDDGLTWAFRLRDDVVFHDGSALTADDVVASLERIRREGQNAYRLAPVETIRAVDPSTVELTLDRPTPNLLVQLGAFKGMAIAPRASLEAGTLKRQPVGTGPFRFVEFVAGDRVVLERHDDHWRDGLPHLERLVFRPIPDPTVKLTNLRGGQVDWIDGVPLQRLGSLEADPAVEVETVPAVDFWYMGLNCTRPPFDERRVRRALAFAIDREAITTAARFEAATVNQSAIPRTSPWHHPYTPYRHDPAHGRQLLDQAGIETLSMELMVTNEFPETVTAAQVIASQLGEIGIDVVIRELDFSAWLAEQSAGSFDALLLGWLGNLDPDDFYYAQHHSQGKFNFHGFTNPEVDRLLEAGRVETDRTRREAIYAEVTELLVDEADYLYLYNSHQVAAWRPAVGGFRVRPDAAVRFRGAWLTE